MPLYQYQSISPSTDEADDNDLLKQLRAKLPRMMREQLSLETQSRAYFVLAMLSDDDGVHQLRALLQEQYPVLPTEKKSIEQALALVSQLQKTTCNHQAPFKFRLPSYLGEYPIHSQEIYSKINQFNQLIEAYYQSEELLDAAALDQAYQAILVAIEKHYSGCIDQSLWQLLKAMSAWSTSPIDELLQAYPALLSSATNADKPAAVTTAPLPSQSVVTISQAQAPAPNRQADGQPFTASFNYKINEAGRIEQSNYLLLNGFALKPGGHADALSKKIPDFLSWAQWQCNIRRQLSQLIKLPCDEEFFDWLQTVLQRLGVEFLSLHASSYQCYVSPFLNHKKTLNALNEEMLLGILQEQCEQVGLALEAAYLPIISRYLIKFLYGFQFNRGQALGIGANWGGVISDSNEAGADAFRFNDSEWAAHFKNLSIHRQGPAEARMNAAIGIQYEFEALLSSFDHMTQLQVSEHADTLYNALVDNLITGLFPEPIYFENTAYTKYRRHYVVSHTDEGMQQINSFYQPDPQGTYYKTKNGDYKQTPMFRQAGSLVVEPFPRDNGSGDCSQSLSVANPLWALQLQYAQSSSSSIRGHIVYNPIGPDEFIPDTFYGQTIRESAVVFVPFIGVIPKNFDGHFNQVELCASFVVRMLHSSRLMTYCPTFAAHYFAIMSRFLPSIEGNTQALPSQHNAQIKHKWDVLDEALHDPQRTAEACHKAFMSLFKELIYSLYSLTKEDADLHYYFVELTTSAEAFTPQNRATCERLIRELTTLKPLQTPDNTQSRQQYELILSYLGELTDFFYPKPCDESAKAIAEQALLHAKHLLSLPAIKAYFVDLGRQYQANISPKVSPGLMHDAIKYQGPSPDVGRDFYHRRHETNFPSGYRDMEGGQMVRPSARETLLDKIIKTGGALLPLIHRNKTIFSIITQPFSQAYILGHEAYLSKEHYKVLWGIVHGIGGFIYGLGLGARDVLNTIPKTIYNAWFAPAVQQHHANHALAISSAPSNEPGLRVEAIMDVRDHLLQCMATTNAHALSSEQLISRLAKHMKKLHPSLLSRQLTTEARYKEILLDTFPLDPIEWQQLFEPVIRAGNRKNLQRMINKYALQIDCVFIHALYECLTTPNGDQDTKALIKRVIDTHKLREPQDKILAEFVHYYTLNPKAKRDDIAQYRFQGTAITKLKEKEQGLRKLQTWMNNALDQQWILEAMLTRFMEQYLVRLNQKTLLVLVSKLPDSIKAVLHELLVNPGNDEKIIANYQLDEPQKAFLLQCSSVYKAISTQTEQELILARVALNECSDSSLSIKAQEHLKLTQFVQREWQHQLLAMNAVQPIIDDIKKQTALSYHPALDELASLYQTGLENNKSTKAFDAFYSAAIKIQGDCARESHLHEWVNVTMNVFVNGLLDQLTWTNDKLISNPLSDSQAVVHWLNHLMTQKNGIRALLAQQVEQAPSFDAAAWRCQHILRALEASQPNQEYIRGTGMQKLVRLICQNTNVFTAIGEQKAKKVPIAALCRHSITMQHALERVKEKVPDHDFVRAIEIGI